MPHLSARPCLGFAVEMEMGPALFEEIRPLARFVADEIIHHDAAQPLRAA